MSLATDYGAAHRQALIRAARVATACRLTIADQRRAERERRAHLLAVYALGDLLATLVQRDQEAHAHLEALMHGVVDHRQPIPALHSAAERYALALLESDEGAR